VALLGDLTYRSEDLRKALAEVLASFFGDRAIRGAVRSEATHRARPFEPQEGLWYGRDLGRPQGHIKEPWA
jgi:hypothetical protein